jgi:hypothetical protein
MLFSKYIGRRKGTRRSAPVRLFRRVKRKANRSINRRYRKYGRRGC